MEEIIKVDIVLENCEYITLDAKYFGEFFLNDLNERVKRIASNCIAKTKTAKEVAIEILKDANDIKYAPFGQGTEEKIFNRLTQYNDITSFRVYYKKDESDKKTKKEDEQKYEDIYIDWYGDSDNENESQISYISSQGNLYIVIAKDKNIEDFFVPEEIEDDETMDFHRSMIIGD